MQDGAPGFADVACFEGAMVGAELDAALAVKGVDIPEEASGNAGPRTFEHILRNFKRICIILLRGTGSMLAMWCVAPMRPHTFACASLV